MKELVHTRILDAYPGMCAVCGNEQFFTHSTGSRRESYKCLECRSSLRQRMLAESLVSFLGRIGDETLDDLASNNAYGVRIHEFGYVGPFRKRLQKIEGYTCSHFEDLPSSSAPERKENLLSSSFEDSELDAVITVEILGHVFQIEKVLAEIHRILKPGGLHFFSTPMDFPIMETSMVRAVTDADGNVTNLLEPRYHVGSNGNPSLVTYDFGRDLEEFHSIAGLNLYTVRAYDLGVKSNLSFVAQKIS